jgi:hypothetical protein
LGCAPIRFPRPAASITMAIWGVDNMPYYLFHSHNPLRGFCDFDL